MVLVSSCASYKPQYKNKTRAVHPKNSKEVAHAFYLLGDGGNSPIGTETTTLKRLRTALNAANQESTLLFLGDNIYPAGMPKKGHPQRAFAEHQLNIQTAIAQNFKGNTYFIPGNHDWNKGNKDGLEFIKRQEDYIQDFLKKKVFHPSDGCPGPKEISLNDEITLIVIDTQWWLHKYDKARGEKDGCDLRTESDFLGEFNELLKKNREKHVMVVGHHPLYSLSLIHI